MITGRAGPDGVDGEVLAKAKEGHKSEEHEETDVEERIPVGAMAAARVLDGSNALKNGRAKDPECVPTDQVAPQRDRNPDATRTSGPLCKQ